MLFSRSSDFSRRQGARFSIRSTISEMFHGRDQLPLGPHANRVLMHRLVDDRERHKRRQFEILQADADLGGALADHADVRRGGENLVDAARALVGAVGSVLKRKPGDRRQLVSVKLIERSRGTKSGNRSNETKRLTKRRVSIGNWPSSAGSHLS
jgi:hypothetical protein